MKYRNVLAALVAVVFFAACDTSAPGLVEADGINARAIEQESQSQEAVMLRGKSADQKLLAQVRAATAKYHDVSVAEDDGYVSTVHCVAIPGGGMGVHYVNFGLVMDGEPDVPQPEVLVYEPTKDGEMRLVAVEWVVLAEFVDEAPVLFGQTFDGPVVRDPEVGAQYDLHAWIWRNNPNGMFAPFNPKVSCPTE